MSRRIERAGSGIAVADNAVATAFTVPGGFKYELLEVRFGTIGTSGLNAVTYIDPGSGLRIIEAIVGAPAGTYAPVHRFNNFPFFPGEMCKVQIGGNGAPWTWYASYVKVTL